MATPEARESKTMKFYKKALGFPKLRWREQQEAHREQRLHEDDIRARH